MKTKRTLLFFVFAAMFKPLYAQVNLEWYTMGGFNSGQDGWAITSDNSSNVYLTGTWWNCSYDTLNFGSNWVIADVGVFGGDDFLVKLNANGKPQWLKAAALDSAAYAWGKSVAADGNDNVYETGYFKGTVHFGTNTFVKGIHYNGIFLVKYDANGNVMWAQSPVVSNTNVDMGLAVTTDKNNDVYMAGIFTDTIQFGTYQFISSPGLQALFIVKYDASGNVLWAQSPNGTVNYQQSTNRNELSLAADKADHIYLTGSYSSSTITFGPHTLTNIGSDNIYMVKFDMAGNTIWARSAGGQIQDAPNKIAIDRTNNVYITGTFTSPTCSFGPHVLTTTNSTEFFIAKYDTGGNALWAKASKSPTRGYSVAIDSCNNILASGACDSVVSIDSLTYTVSVGGFDESFYLKFDSTGKVLNGFVFESGGDDQDDLTSDKFGDIIMGGDFAVAVTMGTTTIPKGCSETADIIKFQLGEKCCRQSSNETVCCSSTINPGQSVNLDVNPAGGSNTYSWYPATGVSCDTCPSITVTPSVTTTYYVCTITNGGKDCENEEVTITVDNGCQDFTVPNVFTPNNDEQNDEFTINALGMDSYTIDIYDRWGIKEFHANNASISWDGHNPSGNQVTDGVYYYIIKATCQGKPFDKKGFVQVIR